MYCSNCGKMIPDGSRFCKYCGEKQNEEVLDARNEERPERAAEAERPNRPDVGPASSAEEKRRQKDSQKKQKKGKKKGRAVRILGIVLCVVVVLFAAGGFVVVRSSLNLNDYLSDPVYEGWDTIGTASVSFDTERFEEDLYALLEKHGLNTEDLEDAAEFAEVLEAEDLIDQMEKSGTLDPVSGLENGDTVTHRWDCEEEVKTFRSKYFIFLRDKDVDYTVTGLTEVGEFDAFEGVKVTFAGASPDGTASVSIPEPTEIQLELTYTVSPSVGLSEGDTVTVTVTAGDEDVDEYCISNYGRKPKKASQKFEVTGLSQYVSSLEEVPDELISQLRESADERFRTENGLDMEGGGDRYTLTPIGEWLVPSGEGGTDGSRLFLLYKAQVRDWYTDADGNLYAKTNEFYWYLLFRNLVCGTDGTVAPGEESPETPTAEVAMTSGINAEVEWKHRGYESLEAMRTGLSLSLDTLQENVDESQVPTEIAEEKITLAVPTLDKVEANDKGGLKVSWSTVGGASGYQIQFSTKKNFTKKSSTKQNVDGGGENSVTLKDLKPGTTYYVRIQQVKKIGENTYWSDWSNVIKKKVKETDTGE